MNRKHRRAAARKKKNEPAGIPAIPEMHEDIRRALSLYFSSPPGAGGANNASGASGGGSAACREARALVKRRLQNDPALWGEALGLAADLAKGGKWEDAMNTFRDIAELCPDNAEALANVGTMLLCNGKLKEAKKTLSRAVELDPTIAMASNNLGSMLLSAGQPEAAVGHFKNAVAAQPEFIEYYVNLCYALKRLGDWDQAKIFADMTVALADYSLGFSPNVRQVYRTVCDFDSLGKLGDVWEDCEHIATDKLTAVFLDLLVYAEDTESILRLRDLVLRWARHVEKQAAAQLPVRTKRASRAKLRVGILSSDLCSHSVSRFLIPLIRNYDRERFEIHCYTPVRQLGDSIQHLFMGSVDKFSFVEGMTDREIAAALQADDVDILLELNGFTQGSRIATLAYKPAPVQISWLGYPFTSGLKAIDYFIIDRFMKPADESLFVEEMLIMPGAPACFGNFPDVPIEEGLPADRNGRITFGTLNSPYKFTPKMIALWARVMNQVPDSRFLFVRAQARSLNLCKNLSQEFAKHGVSPDRLFLFDNTQEKRNHLYYYNDIDISLDTFPLTGGATTCEATWMGVPVITLVGESLHQRISYGYLMHSGLEEFCTFTPGDFVDRAAALAGDRDRLLAWRHGLRDVMRQSPLCDDERFLFEFQEMLEQVAEVHGLRSAGRAEADGGAPGGQGLLPPELGTSVKLEDRAALTAREGPVSMGVAGETST